MGAAARSAPAVRLSPDRAKPVGGGGAAEFERSRCSLQIKDRAWADHRADLPAAPQVKLPKRLDLARDAERALDSVPGLIVANWVKVHAR